jgi:hypothetical protein
MDGGRGWNFNLGRNEVAVFSGDRRTLDQYVNDAWIRTLDSIEKVSESVLDGERAITVEYRFGALNRYGFVTAAKHNDRFYVLGFTAGGFVCDDLAGLMEFKFIN